MDFSFSETQEAVRGLARQVLADHATDAALRAVEQSPDRFPHRLWQALAQAGLLGTALPEEHGGGGQGLLELCVLFEAAGAAAVPSPLFPTLALGALPIAEFGRAEQKQRFLPGVSSGQLLLSAALAEPGAPDPAQPSTLAERGEAGWLLRGVKDFVPWADRAARVVVPARLSAGGVGVFLLDPRAGGVRLEPQQTTSGEPQFRMVLERARVAAPDVLAEPPLGSAIVEWMTDRALAGLCALELGLVDRALRMTAEHTKARRQFERPIATFQAVAQRAADAYIDVETIRLATWRAVWLLASGRPAAHALAVAKFFAAEAGHRVVYAAQHLHGGIGFDRDYPLHRYYLWSKQIELTLGSARTHLSRLGAELWRS